MESPLKPRLSKSESFVVTVPPEARAVGWLKQSLQKGLLLVVSLVVVLSLGEAVARVLFRHTMDFDMEMWRYATEVKMASENPYLGHVHRPNRQAFLMGVEVTTNRFGLRGRETTLERPANTYRVVVLGDSITMGWGVPQEQTYAAELERMLNAKPPDDFPQGVRYEVLNLGVGNYNTIQEVTSLRYLGLRFDPDLILLGYFINDAEPISSRRDNFLVEHSYLYAFTASRLRRLPLGNFRLLDYKKYYRDLYLDGQPGWTAAQAALAELAELGRKQRIPIVMYILPELHDLSATYPFLDIHQTLTALSVHLGLPVIDLLPAFIGYSPEEALWVSPTDAHPNASGHSRIARAIYDSLPSALMKPRRAARP